MNRRQFLRLGCAAGLIPISPSKYDHEQVIMKRWATSGVTSVCRSTNDEG